MKNLSLTVYEFAKQYIHDKTKVRILKSEEVIFEGTIEELYFTANPFYLQNVVLTVSTFENYICLNCRD